MSKYQKNLRQFGMLIIGEVKKIVQSRLGEKNELHPEWLKYESYWICRQVLCRT